MKYNEATMAAWRLAILVVLSCMTMRESVTQLAGLVETQLTSQSDSQDQQLPAPQSPIPLEGEEAEWLVENGEDTHDCLYVLLAEPKRLAQQVSFDAAHGGGVAPRAILSALHRLRI